MLWLPNPIFSLCFVKPHFTHGNEWACLVCSLAFIFELHSLFQAYLDRKRKRIRERIEANISSAAAARAAMEAAADKQESRDLDHVALGKSPQSSLKASPLSSKTSPLKEKNKEDEESKKEEERVCYCLHINMNVVYHCCCCCCCFSSWKKSNRKRKWRHCVRHSMTCHHKSISCFRKPNNTHKTDNRCFTTVPFIWIYWLSFFTTSLQSL